MGLLDDPSVVIAAASLGVSILVLLVMRAQYRKQFPSGVAADVDRLKVNFEQLRQDLELLGDKVESDIQEAVMVAADLKSVKEALENNGRSMDRLADSVEHKFEALSGRIDRVLERFPRTGEPGDHD